MEIKREGMSLSVKDGFIHEKSLPDLEKLLETEAKRVDSTKEYVIKELTQGVRLVKRVLVYDHQPYPAERVSEITGLEIIEPEAYHPLEDVESVTEQDVDVEDEEKIVRFGIKPGTYYRVEIDIAGPPHYWINGELETLMSDASILHFPSPEKHLKHLGENYYYRRIILNRIPEMEKHYRN